MNNLDVLSLYDRVGPAWADSRSKSLTERSWLDRFYALCPRSGRGRRILDLGCGAGRPIGRYLSERGALVTGVDGSLPMLGLFKRELPNARAVHADMRDLALGEAFDGIIAWDSLFHLSPEDQRPLFASLGAHAALGTILMFTSGPAAGVAIGSIEGEAIYHASLSPEEYRTVLERAGFEVLDFVAEDPTCGGHTIWLARFTAE